MPRPDDSPTPPIIPPQRAMPPWRIVVLSVLATVGIGMAWFGLGPIGSVVTSPPTNAGGSSAIPPASSVTPVTFAEVATLIAYANPSLGMDQTPEPMAVWIADEPPPPFTPTPFPATATYEAQMRSARDVKATATAAAKPKDCAVTLPGRTCLWPSPSPTMPPPMPTVPPCVTPQPGELCRKQ